MRRLSFTLALAAAVLISPAALAQATSNTFSPEVLEYQFNEVRGTSIANTASTFLLPAHGTMSVANWQTDPTRAAFRGNEPGFGCNAYRGTTGAGWVHTGWQIRQTGSMTIMFWMRRDPASTSTNPFGYAFGDVSFRAFAAGGAGQGITFRGTSIGNVDSGFTVTGTPGVWQHVTLVVDDTAGQARWYDNGAPSATVVNFAAGTFSYSGTRFMAVSAQGDSGLSPFGQHYDMDDFRYYSRALTAVEIIAAMGGENPTTSTYDVGCAGNGGYIPDIGSNGAPQLGNFGFALLLSNAEPVRPGAVVLGFSTHGGGAYPIDLSFLLGPGCALGVSPDVSVTIGTDVLGMATLPLPILPAPAFAGGHVYAQFLVIGSVMGSATASLDMNIEF